MSIDLIVILGPTASGKTRLAVRLAKDFNGEIISADSRQIYRGMNIGTGKDLEDYNINGVQVAYHLIDIMDPENEFNLFEFKQYFHRALDSITGRNKIPFLVGGTGLYISSVVQNYKLNKADFSSVRAEELQHLKPDELRQILFSLKPNIHNKTDLTNRDRLLKAILVAEAKSDSQVSGRELNPVVIGIRADREMIKTKITDRLRKRLDEGMISEVEELIKSGLSFEKLDSFGLEYRYVSLYIKGELNYEDMFRKLNTSIHNFAKRQMTWFRKMEREGVKINWIDVSDYSTASRIIRSHLNA